MQKDSSESAVLMDSIEKEIQELEFIENPLLLQEKIHFIQTHISINHDKQYVF